MCPSLRLLPSSNDDDGRSNDGRRSNDGGGCSNDGGRTAMTVGVRRVRHSRAGENPTAC